MKNNIIAIVSFVGLIISSCSDKCIEGKQAVPASFFVEILDETTSENVFENETFSSADISVTDVIGNDIPYEFVEDIKIIQLLPKTTINARNIDIKITLNNQTTMITEEINLKYDVESEIEECYTSFKITNVLFPENPSEYVEGVFLVKI
jgi:hypothetical protein